MNSCLSLGTAQFGEGYGATNSEGRLSDSQVREILICALESGISRIDTADAYQDALARVGRELPVSAEVEITSKFLLNSEWWATPVERIRDQLSRLRRDSIDCLLVHNARAIPEFPAVKLRQALSQLVSEGLIRRYGVSVYDETELEQALEALPDLGTVQIPGSIVDVRLLQSELVSAVHESGVQIQVRSAFLQGLLLCDESSLPRAHRALSPVISRLRTVASARGESVLAGTLAFLRHDPIVDVVVVGSLSTQQLSEITDAWDEGSPEWTSEAINAEVALVDPRCWARA
jgi:aryl-alcohol dehydrogenase-like predicted oxidoreductase